ncbi:glycosyltransferase family 2 protein [Galbitalea soli]|uniref:Glycosyltransferase family 2 protein n=1 Tax=Galbitalea soli TaxID=1268042 RepID=A0A7C9PL40_9MICO|nr:glycosyltransferase family 2 protein [Galbitalea soli]NEM89970.1 glycosyltransferase family 2 protein [Galbitalea soli]NYJ30676.1 GT2 family glycosyltransferase [Galbitalea soli]
MPTPESESVSRIAIVVVNYRSHQLIDENFAVPLWPAGQGRVVVVDNFSDALEAAAIRELCGRRGFELVEPGANLGFGAGMNRGVERAIEGGATQLLLVNPDAVIRPDVVAALRRQLDDQPLTMVSPRVVRSDGSTWFGGARVLLDEGVTTTRPGSDSGAPDGWLSGACLALTARLWERIGGFDDDYFLYWEDVDLSWRARAAGGALLVRGDLTVEHAVGGTQDHAGKSPLYVYYNVRNRMVFARKHLTPAQQRAWARTSLRSARRVVLRGGRRALARHPLALGGAMLRGLRDGVRWRPEEGTSL